VIVRLKDDHITVWPQHKVEEFIQMDAPGIAHFKPQYISAISSNGNALKVDGISRVFELGDEKIHALKDVSFDVRAGKLALIRGRSGSGKTTLLNLITALAQPTNGENCVGNLSVTDMTGSEIIQYQGKQISFIFQTFGLLPFLTVEENVEVPLRLVNTPCKERQERVAEALSLVSLDHRAKRRTYELSGGEQQRVAISRALANRPSNLLADEPTGQLDRSTGATIIGLLHENAERFGVTVIVASHDPNIIRFTDIIIEFEDGKLVNIQEKKGAIPVSSVEN
jgi:putative ABC transport system ATP-binding protein